MGDIVVIGAGGTASHLIPALMRMADDNIVHIWDADTVTDDNLVRQMFDHQHVAQPKAKVFADKFGSNVSAHLEYVGEAEMERAIQEGDTVFICADNMTVRRLIDQRAAALNDVIIINGGNEKTSGSAQIHIRRNGTNITPRISYHSPEITREDPDLAGLSCAEIAILPGGEQTMLANMTVAALMLQAYQRTISQAWDQADPTWTKITFDIFSGDWQTSDVRLNGSDWI